MTVTPAPKPEPRVPLARLADRPRTLDRIVTPVGRRGFNSSI